MIASEDVSTLTLLAHVVCYLIYYLLKAYKNIVPRELSLYMFYHIYLQKYDIYLY